VVSDLNIVVKDNSLMFSIQSVLKTFIHDPLVEWNRGRGRGDSTVANKETVFISLF